MPLLFLFLIWPLLEIAVFAYVGSHIGVLDTVLVVIGMAVLGGLMVQLQGLRTIAAIQTSLDQGRLPVQDIFDGACLFVAGVLMVIPGFISDIMAFMLLLSPLRRLLHGIIAQYFTGEKVTLHGFTRAPGREESIDAEYTDITVQDDTEDNPPPPRLLP